MFRSVKVRDREGKIQKYSDKGEGLDCRMRENSMRRADGMGGKHGYVWPANKGKKSLFNPKSLSQ